MGKTIKWTLFIVGTLVALFSLGFIGLATAVGIGLLVDHVFNG